MDREEARRKLEGAMETLAALEHERWAHWQRYMHEKGVVQDDGSLLIGADLVRRWETQISTDYERLSDEEKESDRDQVRRYLPALVEAISAGGGGRSRAG